MQGGTLTHEPRKSPLLTFSARAETRVQLTAFNSPRFPFFAKCALKLAFALPAHTPQSERSTLEKLSSSTRAGFGNAGDKQSRTMAVSLSTSAANRYILHSGSSAVPNLWAKRMVAIRPMDSCRTESSSAAVGEALESPTPTPGVCRALACGVGG